jgi:EAL domain-containing protein (putative c-di-GMP-specific phosphodiesterase class I)
MVDIDRWIIRKAISELAQHRREGRKITFFISLAQSSLKDKDLLLCFSTVCVNSTPGGAG